MKKISSQIISLFVAIITLIVTLVVFPAIKSEKYDNDDMENKTNYEEVNEELVEIGLVEIIVEGDFKGSEGVVQKKEIFGWNNYLVLRLPSTYHLVVGVPSGVLGIKNLFVGWRYCIIH